MVLEDVRCANIARGCGWIKQESAPKKKDDVSYLYACVSDGLTYLLKNKTC